MTMALVKDDTSKAIARPLSVLVPLIKEAMAEEQKTATEMRREVGLLLLEAQDRMKADGKFYAKKGQGFGARFSGEWGKWLKTNFSTLKRSMVIDYMRLAAASRSTESSRFTSINAMKQDRSTRRDNNKNVGGKGRAQRLIEFLSDPKNDAQREAFADTLAQDRARRATEDTAVERVMAEIIKAGFTKLLDRYHPDKNKSATTETFNILDQARKRLEKYLR